MRLALVALLAATACAPSPGLAEPSAADAPLVVFLVRHAEKTDAVADPPLTDAGRRRAESLAHVLADAGLDHVHSSDFARTLETAAPVARALELDVRRYDPHDLPALVERLVASGGRHLVVGHSNTTPAAVELLGGEPGAPIEEHGENDRLYVVTVDDAGRASTVLLRFGEPFER